VSVVVAVDMGTWDLLGEVNGKDRPRRRVAARSKKPWLATVFGAKEGRLATGATMESSDAERGSVGRKTLGDGRAGVARAVGGCWRCRRHWAGCWKGSRATVGLRRRPRAYPHI